MCGERFLYVSFPYDNCSVTSEQEEILSGNAGLYLYLHVTNANFVLWASHQQQESLKKGHYLDNAPLCIRKPHGLDE